MRFLKCLKKSYWIKSPIPLFLFTLFTRILLIWSSWWNRTTASLEVYWMCLRVTLGEHFWWTLSLFLGADTRRKPILTKPHLPPALMRQLTERYLTYLASNFRILRIIYLQRLCGTILVRWSRNCHILKILCLLLIMKAFAVHHCMLSLIIQKQH